MSSKNLVKTNETTELNENEEFSAEEAEEVELKGLLSDEPTEEEFLAEVRFFA